MIIAPSGVSNTTVSSVPFMEEQEVKAKSAAGSSAHAANLTAWLVIVLFLFVFGFFVCFALRHENCRPNSRIPKNVRSEATEPVSAGNRRRCGSRHRPNRRRYCCDLPP